VKAITSILEGNLKGIGIILCLTFVHGVFLIIFYLSKEADLLFKDLCKFILNTDDRKWSIIE